MTGTVVVHKTQVGQSNTAANNFTIRTLDDGILRVSRGNAGDASPTDVMRVKADNSVEFPGGISGISTLSAEVVASGTAVDFTALPANIKRIVVSFYRVSTNGSSPMELRLGTSGGIAATGYIGGATTSGGSSASTTGLMLTRLFAAADIAQGQAIIQRMGTGSTKWAMSGNIVMDDGTFRLSASSIDLAAELTQLRITTQGGTATFDGGSFSIMYEV